MGSLTPAERQAIWIAGVVFIIGLALTSHLNANGKDNTALVIALLLIPLIVYCILSGKLREFSAPGGWVAKFQEAAAEKIKPASLTECIENIQVVQKGGVDALQEQGQRLQKGRPVALTLQLGNANHDASALQAYIETLRISDPEMSVLFLDQAGALIVYAEASAILGLLRQPAQSGPLMAAIKQPNIGYLMALPGFAWQTISSERSNAEALQLMRELNARTLVVVDAQKRPIGIVKRDHIMARLLIELTGTRKI
jgi:hypothetical protein